VRPPAPRTALAVAVTAVRESRFARLLPPCAAGLAVAWGYCWLVLELRGPAPHLLLLVAFALLALWGLMRAR
jgi:hypothetical protein